MSRYGRKRVPIGDPDYLGDLCRRGNAPVHLSVGNQARYEAWLEHFRDLVRRGLPAPLTVTTEGVPELIRAVDLI